MMETISSDDKTLEIEKKLRITVFLSQPRHFCGEEIITFEPHKSKSLVFHSLDGNHNNWDPDNKVPSHKGCHQSFHNKGRDHHHMNGDNNPMKDPKVKAKHLKSVRTSKNRFIHSELAKGKNNPNYGDKVSPEEWRIRSAKGWATRRKGGIQDLG